MKVLASFCCCVCVISFFRSFTQSLSSLSQIHVYRSISTGAHYVTLDSEMKCEFNCFLLWQTPPIKLKLELYILGGLLRANHLDQSFWFNNQKYCITLFFGGAQLCCAFYGKLCEFGAEKPISWTKLAHFDFFQINFTVWSHILSTVGDALTTVFCATFSCKPLAESF